MRKFYQQCTGIGYCRKSGFRDETSLLLCQELYITLYLFASSMLVELIESKIVNFSFSPAFERNLRAVRSSSTKKSFSKPVTSKSGAGSTSRGFSPPMGLGIR